MRPDSPLPNRDDEAECAAQVGRGSRVELAGLVDASVELRRALVRLDARRFVSIHEAVQFAVRHAQAFVSSHVSPTGRQELARRAVIAECR
ncbi:hypothetical protein [Agromyces aerolatus]|uniref:hypothetical protein n=1 Tax=Agromyces sp. LY-1074 TaxID=3074080 RepID=UPI002857A950|nr:MULTISPECIES: hypothetical protein [unclassified Agromyces]MDR5698546.1 hypothetical protein [Agromyces sp. LY-1074]MDR5704840.1 hypothetical protein [Agromyces sp. LY-1358]